MLSGSRILGVSTRFDVSFTSDTFPLHLATRRTITSFLTVLSLWRSCIGLTDLPTLTLMDWPTYTAGYQSCLCNRGEIFLSVYWPPHLCLLLFSFAWYLYHPLKFRDSQVVSQKSVMVLSSTDRKRIKLALDIHSVLRRIWHTWQDNRRTLHGSI